MNPFLWCVLWSVVFAILTYGLRDDAVLKYICLALAAAPEIAALGIGLMFAVKDPDRLQSKEHIQRMAQLTVLKKNSEPKVIDAATQSSRLENLRGGTGGGQDQ
jgi:hypothetical protein